jgi:hypothetical protein
MSETKKFTAAQFSALSHPLTGGEDAPDEACKRRTSKEGASGILTCDIDDETVETFGGPVWHASALRRCASMPSRCRAGWRGDALR